MSCHLNKRRSSIKAATEKAPGQTNHALALNTQKSKRGAVGKNTWRRHIVYIYIIDFISRGICFGLKTFQGSPLFYLRYYCLELFKPDSGSINKTITFNMHAATNKCLTFDYLEFSKIRYTIGIFGKLTVKINTYRSYCMLFTRVSTEKSNQN